MLLQALSAGATSTPPPWTPTSTPRPPPKPPKRLNPKCHPEWDGILLMIRSLSGCGLDDPHPVKRPVHEDKRHCEEDDRQDVAEARSLAVRQTNREFHRQQPEQRGELDDRVHSDR